MAVDDDLTMLEDQLRRLKIEYDVYFGGGSKKPPVDTEWKVKNLLKKASDGTRMNYAQRYRYNTLQQRYALHNALWQQKLLIKVEGYRRPQDQVMGIQGMSIEQEQEAKKALSHHHHKATDDAPFSIACSDVDADHSKVESLFTALTQAREKSGDKNSPSLDSFKKFVRQKTAQLRKEYACDAVEYSVEMQGGQVKLKAKPKT